MKAKSETDLAPSDQSPMSLDSSTQSNLLSLLGTSWRCQLDSYISSFKRNDSTTRLTGSDVDEQCLSDGKFGYFGLFGIVGLDTE